MPSRPVPTVLSIAGSDSGGGAGIQADLKAFARCGVHGMTAVTALTAQSTTGVSAIHPVPPEFVVEQVRVVADDLGVDAVKTGMLGTEETVEAVVTALELLPGSTPVVVDPVMVAESGATLLDEAARAAVVRRLLPRATVITPNLPEARVLAETAGLDVADDPEALARALNTLGPRMVVVTGGHRDEATDVCFDGEDLVTFSGERFPDGASHGSGCTHASALAAHLALGVHPFEAAWHAKEIAAAAVREGLRELGAGAGPVDVFGLRTGRAALGAPVPEAETEDTPFGRRPTGPGWFVLNLDEVAGWRGEGAGISTMLEWPEGSFAEIGVNVHVLEPGDRACLYHAESVQEDFLVLAGEPLLLVEEQERRLRTWDFVHCPPGTRHAFVGAGDRRAAILMLGTRRPGDRVLYEASEVAARHRASSAVTTSSGRVAYRDWPEIVPGVFPWPP